MNIQTLNSFSLLFEMNDEGTELLHIIKTSKKILKDADTGNVIGNPIIEAVAVTQEEATQFIGAEVANLNTQIEALKESNSEKDKTITGLNKDKEDLTSQIDSLNSQITSLQKQIEDLQKPVEPPTPTVPKMTRLQARLVLAQVGKLEEIDNAISQLPVTDPGRIYYENATEWYRDNPILNQMAPAFGITSEQLDEMFVLGPQLGV